MKNLVTKKSLKNSPQPRIHDTSEQLIERKNVEKKNFVIIMKNDARMGGTWIRAGTDWNKWWSVKYFIKVKVRIWLKGNQLRISPQTLRQLDTKHKQEALWSGVSAYTDWNIFEPSQTNSDHCSAEHSTLTRSRESGPSDNCWWCFAVWIGLGGKIATLDPVVHTR